MYIFVWHMNSFKLVFAMVMYLSWKSTQICTNKIFRNQTNIFVRFELSAGSYIIIPATFETGAASNFMIRVLPSPSWWCSGLTKSTWWCWPRWQCWQLLALLRMLINLTLSTEGFWPSWWCWISWLYWEISRKWLQIILQKKIRKPASVIASALL